MLLAGNQVNSEWTADKHIRGGSFETDLVAEFYYAAACWWVVQLFFRDIFS